MNEEDLVAFTSLTQRFTFLFGQENPTVMSRLPTVFLSRFEGIAQMLDRADDEVVGHIRRLDDLCLVDKVRIGFSHFSHDVTRWNVLQESGVFVIDDFVTRSRVSAKFLSMLVNGLRLN